MHEKTCNKFDNALFINLFEFKQLESTIKNTRMSLSTDTTGCPLAFSESCASHPTSRTFILELPSGEQMHVCFTALSRPVKKHSSTTLHRPSNLQVNQAIQSLANHKPLHTY